MADSVVGKVCPKCSYKRTAQDTAPDWQCPKCGVAYAKAAAAAAGAAPAAATAARPAAPTYAPADNRPIAPSGFGESVSAAVKGYAKFSGRSGRAEYWWFFLFWLIAILVTGVINENLGGIVWLALLLPNLAVSVRRLHDIGKSGLFYLLNLIPVFGGLLLLYWAVQPSDSDNDYGPAPV